MNTVELIREAFKAQSFSYSPYSNFQVGAALLTLDGKVYHGCNIESAAYTPTNCAERTAFFKAVSEGKYGFSKIAVVGNLKSGRTQKDDYTAPCGVCRQVMMEFCNQDFEIILAKSEDDYKVLTLSQLLPLGFGPENLKE